MKNEWDAHWEDNKEISKVEKYLRDAGFELKTRKQYLSKYKYTFYYKNHDGKLEIPTYVKDARNYADDIIKYEDMAAEIVEQGLEL